MLSADKQHNYPVDVYIRPLLYHPSPRMEPGWGSRAYASICAFIDGQHENATETADLERGRQASINRNRLTAVQTKFHDNCISMFWYLRRRGENLGDLPELFVSLWQNMQNCVDATVAVRQVQERQVFYAGNQYNKYLWLRRLQVLAFWYVVCIHVGPWFWGYVCPVVLYFWRSAPAWRGAATNSTTTPATATPEI